MPWAAPGCATSTCRCCRTGSGRPSPPTATSPAPRRSRPMTEHEHGPPAVHASHADGWAVLEQAAELTRRGDAFALATVVWRQGPSSGQQGSRAIITESGDLHGWIGGACAEPVVIREAREVISEGGPRLLLLGAPEQFGSRAEAPGMTLVPISCQSEGALEVYIEPVLPAPHLVIVGRSPMAGTLAELAQALGWRVTPRDGAEFRTEDADEASMVVVATQG